MKQTSFFLVNLALIALTTLSCSSSPKHWYKMGATAKTFEHDKADCEDALLQAGSSPGLEKIYTFEGCMEDKGWIILDSPQASQI